MNYYDRARCEIIHENSTQTHKHTTEIIIFRSHIVLTSKCTFNGRTVTHWLTSGCGIHTLSFSLCVRTSPVRRSVIKKNVSCVIKIINVIRRRLSFRTRQISHLYVMIVCLAAHAIQLKNKITYLITIEKGASWFVLGNGEIASNRKNFHISMIGYSVRVSTWTTKQSIVPKI